ncbi:MAG: hypothetical protein QNJ40_23375 [Xanthomonadales bacterium]|nr:hypothetical protein [Xanthomonadales bacterium]
MRLPGENLTKLSVFLLLFFIHTSLSAQYLRDRTRVSLQGQGFSESRILELYDSVDVHPLRFDNVFSIPEIDVGFGARQFPLLFDFGNSGNITITTALEDAIEYQVTGSMKTYTADGRDRGQGFIIVIPQLKILHSTFQNETGSLMDWRIYATEPFNGMVGLKYFDNTCMTVSYRDKSLAVSQTSITDRLTDANSRAIELLDISSHPFGIHFRGKLNSDNVIVYFDTGKSASFVNSDLLASAKIETDKTGSYYQDAVQVAFGDLDFEISYPRVKSIRRDIDDDMPVGMEVGSDVLKHFAFTIDRTNNRNQLIIHK